MSSTYIVFRLILNNGKYTKSVSIYEDICSGFTLTRKIVANVKNSVEHE